VMLFNMSLHEVARHAATSHHRMGFAKQQCTYTRPALHRACLCQLAPMLMYLTVSECLGLIQADKIA
jgi:hypothetical protein